MQGSSCFTLGIQCTKFHSNKRVGRFEWRPFLKIHCFHPVFLLIYNLNVKQFGSQVKPHILLGFIWIQIVCKCHQRSSKFTASWLRVKTAVVVVPLSVTRRLSHSDPYIYICPVCVFLALQSWHNSEWLRPRYPLGDLKPYQERESLSVPFLDLSISNGIISSTIYDKLDDSILLYM